MIINVNKNYLQKIESLENIEVPYIPIIIIEKILKDYEFMKKFLEYKRDATLALLNIYGAIIIYDDNFDLMVEIKVSKWDEFFTFIKNYAKTFISEGLNFYKSKQKNEFNNNFQIINENFLGPIIKKIFYEIYLRYLKKFPYWPQDSVREQNDYINIELTNQTDINNIRYYWNFQGIIFIQDTKNNESNSFKVKFNGKPKFQMVLIDLNQLKYLKTIENDLKQYIDMIEDKIIAQNLKNLNLEFDF